MAEALTSTETRHFQEGQRCLQGDSFLLVFIPGPHLSWWQSYKHEIKPPNLDE